MLVLWSKISSGFLSYSEFYSLRTLFKTKVLAVLKWSRPGIIRGRQFPPCPPTLLSLSAFPFPLQSTAQHWFAVWPSVFNILGPLLPKSLCTGSSPGLEYVFSAICLIESLPSSGFCSNAIFVQSLFLVMPSKTAFPSFPFPVSLP